MQTGCSYVVGIRVVIRKSILMNPSYSNHQIFQTTVIKNYVNVIKLGSKIHAIACMMDPAWSVDDFLIKHSSDFYHRRQKSNPVYAQRQ